MHFAVGDSGKNDHHFICYSPEATTIEGKKERNKQLKNFRDLHV